MFSTNSRFHRPAVQGTHLTRRSSSGAWGYSRILLALLVLLAALSYEAGAQDTVPTGPIYPVVNCVEFPADPSTGTFTAHFGYTNTGPYQFVPFLGPQNFTFPDQPNGNAFVADFAPGNHPDIMTLTGNLMNAANDPTNLGEIWFVNGNGVASYPVSDSQDENGNLDDPTPVCVPSPKATPLNYTAPGVYPRQALATVTFGPQSATPSAVVISPAANISVSNVTYSPGPPATLYGDVTVIAGPPVTSAVLLQLIQTPPGSAPVTVASTTSTISFSGSVASSTGCPVNVTSSVKGQLSAPLQLFGTQIYTQLLTIKNTSGSAITGPIEVALNGLSSNAKLFTAGATATCPGVVGAPVIYITGTLAPNAQGAVVLTFTNTQIPNATITYTPVILSGGSRL